MTSHQRIALNTAATYARSLLSLALALFSSRWVLKALGQSDFGLFSVVGSIIVFIVFMNSVLAGSASRQYAYSIGQVDSAELHRWFNAALSAHLVLATAVVVTGWPVGEYVIRHVLTIPVDRVSACLWVFRLSLASAFASMLSIPYVAMFTAKQNLAELAVWGIVASLMNFALAWSLGVASGDRLLYYAAGVVSIVIVTNIGQALRARAAFIECRIVCRQWFDKRRLGTILSFAGWSLIGGSGMILRDQGSAILLNIRFGPTVNAAFGVAKQISDQANQLAAAMAGAMSPEVTASEGRGDRLGMLSLAQRANKFGTILVMLFALPIVWETEYILRLWLVEPPLHTAVFCQLILITVVLDRLSAGNVLALNAHGRIAAYQATLGTCHMLSLPLAWVLLALGGPPTSIGIAFVVTMGAVSVGRVLWLRRLLGVPTKRWFFDAVAPSALVALSAGAVVIVPRLMLPASLSRLVIIVAASTSTMLLTAWLFALDKSERTFVASHARRMMAHISTRPICRVS